MVSWRDQQKERLKEHLYFTSLGLLEEKDFQETTVQEITETAGVSKATFFNHFPSKGHILTEWFLRITASALEQAKREEVEPGTPAVLALTTALAERASAEPRLYAMKTFNASPMLAETEHGLDDEVARFLGDQLEVAQTNGQLPATLDVGILADVLTATVTGTGRSWVISGQEFDFTQVLQRRIEFLFEAVGLSKEYLQ
jgi:AcrR family transcriptional regulator